MSRAIDVVKTLVGAAIVFCALWIAFGFSARVVAWLFCVGFGCVV